MFGKIKDRLKGVFQKSEEVIDEELENYEELEKKDYELESEDKVFEDKSNDVDLDEVEESRDELSEDVGENIEESLEDSITNKEKDKDKNKKEKDEEEKSEEDIESEDIVENTDNKTKLLDEEESKIEKEKAAYEGEIGSEESNDLVEDSVENSESVGSDEDVEEKKEKKQGFFSRAVSSFTKKKITEDDFDKIWLDLEIFLLEINVAFEIVEKIEKSLREALIGNSFDRFGVSSTIRNVLVEEVREVLQDREGDFMKDFREHKPSDGPLVVMMLGANGTGKTTSIAKLIRFIQNQNLSVVVSSADTFRAAADEQLRKHCSNLKVKCISHKKGSDPAAVAYDGVEHAKSKGLDVVIVDTAGRMPNNSNLMMELQKIKRVSGSHMALFVGDSVSGNDLVDQIELFDSGVGVDGVILTKTDTDERPGSVVTTAYSINKPIYFLGVGQEYDDLVAFDAKLVSEKLFEVED